MAQGKTGDQMIYQIARRNVKVSTNMILNILHLQFEMIYFQIKTLKNFLELFQLKGEDHVDKITYK